MALTRWESIKLSDMPDPEILEPLKSQYHIPSDCGVGSIVKLDGIECVCVATDITIQGSKLRRIAVDRNHDLGYYQKYAGLTQNGIVTNQIQYWRWGGYGTALGNTSTEIGYGLQNTINCLANTVCYTKGSYTGTISDGYPWLWQGVNDFRASHSDKWFVPSLNELKNYVYPNRSSLNFDDGGGSYSDRWSSSENSDSYSYYVFFYNGNSGYLNKYDQCDVRLCRAF